MRILLTGATGFLGSYVLKDLLKANYSVTVLKRSVSNTRRIQTILSLCDCYDLDRLPLEEIVCSAKPDVVIHCATSYGRNEDLSAVVSTNLVFAVNLLESAIENGCGYFINTDSFFCKQIPERLETGKKLYMPEYTLSKNTFREWGQMRANEGKITFINLRMEHIFGADDSKGKFVPWVEEMLEANVPSIDLTSGTQMRDFVPVSKAAEVYSRVLNSISSYKGYCGFDVGTGEAISIREFVENLKEKIGADTELRFGAIPTKENEIMYSAADSRSPFLVHRNGFF